MGRLKGAFLQPNRLAMKEDWEVVAEIPDKTLREILKEEGIPEEDMDKEVEKIRKNATISIGIRAVLITPEVDSALKRMFEFAITGGVCKMTKDEIEKVGEALWH